MLHVGAGLDSVCLPTEGGEQMGSWELKDNSTVIERLHWYAAEYQVMVERSTRWELTNGRLESRVRGLLEQNEELITRLATANEEYKRAWKAVRDAGINPDDGEST